MKISELIRELTAIQEENEEDMQVRVLGYDDYTTPVNRVVVIHANAIPGEGPHINLLSIRHNY